MSNVSTPRYHLVSHVLCPYVQRAVIVLLEKGVPYRRTDIDLAAKPDWFRALSPTGKVPLLQVDGRSLFESVVICEFLEEVEAPPLHPADPLDRAEARAWVEFASGTLDAIAGFYLAADWPAFETKRQLLIERLERLETRLASPGPAGPWLGPWFAGETFGLVDAAFGPLFRYLDTFDRIGHPAVLPLGPETRAYRNSLAARPSVRQAVSADYPDRLMDFLRRRGSYLSRLIDSPDQSMRTA